MRRFGFASGMTGLVVAVLAVSAFSQEPLTDRERQLLESVRLLESRVADLERDRDESRSDALEEQINAMNDSLGALAAPEDFRSFWKSTLRFENEDKSFQLRVGGRVQVDFVWGTQTDELEAALGNDQFTAGALTGFDRFRFEDGVEFRRVRIYLEGQIYSNVEYKLQVDFAGGDADFRDVYIGLTEIPVIGNIRVGQFKQPFGLEQQISSKYTTFLETSLADAFVPSRQTGVMLHRNFAEDDRVFAAISAYRNVDDFGDSNSATSTGAEDGKYNFAMRLTGLPWYEENGKHVLHIGAGFVFENPNDDRARFRSRPEIHLSERFVDTGNFAADDLFRVNVEVALVYESFSVQGEFFYVGTNTPGGNDPEFWGAYLYLSYFLTGEHRPYKKSDASFDRVKPLSNFHDGSDGSGAWELALRGSYIDLNDQGINGGEEFNITFGITWYLNPNTQIKLNYVYANVDDLAAPASFPNEDEGEAHIVGIRFQVDF